jgi:hypothetical protein
LALAATAPELVIEPGPPTKIACEPPPFPPLPPLELEVAVPELVTEPPLLRMIAFEPPPLPPLPPLALAVAVPELVTEPTPEMEIACAPPPLPPLPPLALATAVPELVTEPSPWMMIVFEPPPFPIPSVFAVADPELVTLPGPLMTMADAPPPGDMRVTDPELVMQPPDGAVIVVVSAAEFATHCACAGDIRQFEILTIKTRNAATGARPNGTGRERKTIGIKSPKKERTGLGPAKSAKKLSWAQDHGCGFDVTAGANLPNNSIFSGDFDRERNITSIFQNFC